MHAVLQPSVVRTCALHSACELHCTLAFCLCCSAFVVLPLLLFQHTCPLLRSLQEHAFQPNHAHLI